MGIDYVLDTSNQHPKIKNIEQREEFLVQYTLVVDNKEYRIYGLIWAKDSEDAYDKMPDVKGGDNHYLLKELVIGAVKDEQRREIHDKLHNLGDIVLP